MNVKTLNHYLGQPPRGSSQGFSLIEIMVVVAILALLAGVVTLRLSGTLHKARLEQAVQRFIHTEGQLRGHSGRHRRAVSLHLYLGTDRLEMNKGGAFQKTGSQTWVPKSLGRGIRFQRFLSPTRDETAGKIIVDYSPLATSESFAVQIALPGGKQQWIFVAGVTGQVTVTEKLGELERVLQEDLIARFATESVYAG